MLLYQGKLDEGLKELRAGRASAPDDPRVHEALAKALEAKGLQHGSPRGKRKAQERAVGEVSPDPCSVCVVSLGCGLISIQPVCHE